MQTMLTGLSRIPRWDGKRSACIIDCEQPVLMTTGMMVSPTLTLTMGLIWRLGPLCQPKLQYIFSSWELSTGTSAWGLHGQNWEMCPFSPHL